MQLIGITTPTFQAGWLFGLAALLLMAAPAGVHAYSSYGDYARPIEEGGGGGKFFSGTPEDGYTCDVCHAGASGTKLELLGLPTAGYVPGQTYEIAFQWPAAPADIPHVALMVELTDTNGATAGTTSLVPYARWTEAEKCAQDAFPAADICRAGDEPGCCRDLDPTRDACSFPGERTLFWMLECGARAARFNWTAPTLPIDVWFSASLLTSNTNNDAAGDGVTLSRHRLYPVASSTIRDGALGHCQIRHLCPSSRSTTAITSVFFAVATWLRRRARKRAATSPSAGH